MVLSLLVGGAPEHLSASSSSAIQKKQTRSKKSSSKKKAPNASAKKAQAKKYIDRGKQRIKQKNYAGALNDFQKAHKLAPSKSTQNYIKKLTPLAKKTASAKSSGSAKKKPAPAPKAKPQSPYKLSDSGGGEAR